MYEQAIGRLIEQRLPIEAADARVTYATALLELGEADRAQAELKTAFDAFRVIGATGPCAQIAELLEHAVSGTGRTGPARSS
jgi:hypothetical protein